MSVELGRGDYERLPCGCVMGTELLPDGTRAFVYQPCGPDCEDYLYALAESRRQGKPVTIVDAR